MGLQWAELLRANQSADSLRNPIALLILDGWIKLADNGRSFVQLSPTMRELSRRHPLADVFQPGELT